MDTPAIHGIHHVTLSVTDIDAAVDWFRDVLGFTLLLRRTHGGLDKALCTLGRMHVSFVNHGEASIGDRFNERRVGLDHLSFAVSPDAIDAWGEHLDELGVTRSPVVDGLHGRVLSFRGPDDIALEFYTVAPPGT